MKTEDASLVVAANIGDERAFEELARRYRPLILSKAKSYFIPGAGRDDLRQVGLIGLWVAVRDFDSARSRSFRAFAELCVTCAMIDAVKTATRKKHLLLNESISTSTLIFEDGEHSSTLGDALIGYPSAEQVCLASIAHCEMKDVLCAFEQSLTPLEAGTLKFIHEGKSYHFAAESLGVDDKAIDNARTRLIRKGKRQLGLMAPR